MPPVAAAIAVAVSEWAASITLGSILTSLASSLVLSGLQRLMAPKPSKGSGNASVQNSGITTQIRQAIMVRKPTYGEMRRSGGILEIAMTDNNKFLHLLVEVAPHKVNAIGETWFNDYSIPDDALDGDGNVISGRYANRARIRKHLGDATQPADSFLVAEVPEWTVAHQLNGIAYLYVRLQWDENIYPTGVPNVSCWLKGKEVLDTRTGLVGFSQNLALFTNDYLQDSEFGLGAAATEIDMAFTNSSANVCDEFVTTTDYALTVSAVNTTLDLLAFTADTLYYQRGDRIRMTTTGTLPAGLATATDYYVIPYQRKDAPRIRLATSYMNALNDIWIDITNGGIGTHTVTKKAEPRYSGSITIDTESEVGENIKDLISGMAGMVPYAGGIFRIIAGAYQTPTVSFSEDQIVSRISVQTKVSARERFNTVRGTYISPINDGQPSDYPAIKNSLYIAQDLDTIIRQIDMPVTNRPHTAQRIAKINLELSRQEITWSADFDLSALQMVAGENAFFSVARFGWTNKVFQISKWKLEVREEGETVRPVVNMEMREIASACYDWNNGEETLVDPAPNSDLPSAYDVPMVTNLGVASEAVESQQGDLVFKLLLSWDVSNNQFVVNGGTYELEYKKSTDPITAYRQTHPVAGNFSFAELALVANINDAYDIRIRAVNQLGVKSEYAYILGYYVGTSGTVTFTDDYGTFSVAASSFDDWDTFTNAPTVFDDWGYIT